MSNSTSASTEETGSLEVVYNLFGNRKRGAGTQLEGFTQFSPMSIYMLGVYKQLLLWLLATTYCYPVFFLILEFSTAFECFMREIWQVVTLHLSLLMTWDVRG